MNLKSILLYTIVFIAVEFIPAQTFNFQLVPSEKKQFGVTYDRPFFKDISYATSSVNEFQVYLNIPVSSKLNILANIPYLSYSVEFKSVYPGLNYNYDASGTGNIFLGLQTNQEIVDNRKSILTFGLFLPTADEEVSLAGLYSDYYNLQKYVSNTLGLYFNFAHHRIVDEGFLFAVEAGPNFTIPIEGEGNDAEMFLHYGFNGGFGINKLAVNVELLGIFIVTANPEDFGDRFIHMINLGATWRGDVVTPKIFYKKYLDDYIGESMNGVLGLGVNIALD